MSVGANCNIHSCIIDDDCVIGDNSVIQQGARLERGCQILPNTVVVSGSLIPAGQVWGGRPARFVKTLSEAEQLNNYARSYTEGASEFTSKDGSRVWPHKFEDAPLQDGEQSIEDYTSQHYFNVKH